jgi:limonene 1,2-monooxygenase
MGLEAKTQRPRMEEALSAIMKLLACEEPVTMKTDWFELRQARLHLAPYSYPHMDIKVASSTTPSGVLAASKHGLGLISLGAGLPGGPQKLAEQWRMGEAEAAKHGKTMNRADWRLVVNLHCAEDDERAIREVKLGERIETEDYFGEVLGRPPTRSEEPLRDGLKAGTTLVGSPETVAKGIERLLAFTDGGPRDEKTGAYGAGGILFRAHEWADREQTLRSFELFARWVMPRFQGSLRMQTESREWCVANREGIFAPNLQALKQAFVDAGQDVPDMERLKLRERQPGD